VTDEKQIDRTGWPAGPWDAEPDRLEWRMTEAPGYPCLIVRNDFGSLCGYVGVPPGHPAHGKSYGDELVDKLDVHGGITHGDGCHGRICHVPAPGEPEDVWWLGFDTGHGFDYTPGLRVALARGRPLPAYVEPETGPFEERYRDVSYVRAEVEHLALQLARMVKASTEEPS
jgi:hypothetical protein